MRNYDLIGIKDHIQRNWRWLVFGLILGVIVFIVALFNGYISRLSNHSRVSVLPGLTVVVVPTETLPEPTLQDTHISTPTLTSTSLPSTTVEIDIGELVIVAGTDGDRLRIRTQPGLSSEIGFLAYENDVFQVENGPVEQDGYIWWFLVNPYDGSKSGWAVENYLRRMDNP